MNKLILTLLLFSCLTVNSQVFHINMAAASDARPTVTAFVIPATANGLTIPITTFTATDDIKVVGYKLSLSSTKPSYNSTGWTATPPASYTFTTYGSKTLYAWAKDGTGHISGYKSDGVILTQIDATPPAITSFVIPPTETSLTIAINVFTATDNVAVTGYAITQTNIPPTTFSATAPATYTFTTAGTKTLYAWVRDAANNVSTAATDQCIITLPDVTKPIVNTFAIPATASSLTISITSFTATDNIGVTGYNLTETNVAPGSGWTATAPTTYTFATEGTKTLYAWAKDAAGNISLSLSDQITVTITPPPPPPANYYSTSYPGTEYYVSATGNDANNGTSEATPWLTIAKVNSRTYNAGDAVLLNSVDSFPGQLTISSSGNASYPITIGAYGVDSSKPKIYGSEVITGWTLHSGSIYKKVLTTGIKQLFIDGSRVVLARYPKSDYIPVTTVNSTTSFTATTLPSEATDYYKGAKMIGKTRSWQLYQSEVTGSTGSTITIQTAPTYGYVEDAGFFLTNKLVFLTEAGEWHYDSATKTLYAWMPNSDSPDNHVTRGSVYDNGIVFANGKDYINIQDLEILHQGVNGIYSYDSDNIKILRNTINKCSQYGIYGHYSNRWWEVSENTISDIFTSAIRLSYTSASPMAVPHVISNNVISEICLFSSLGLLPDGEISGSAISVKNGTANITYNKISNVGYNAISIYESVNNIYRNFVDGALKTLDDGAAFYTFNGVYTNAGIAGSTISENIVINTLGNTDGYIYTFSQTYGVYLDSRVHDVTIENNTFGTLSGGVFLNDGGRNIIHENTFYDDMVDILCHDQQEASSVQENTVYKTARIGGIQYLNPTNEIFVDERNTAANTFDYNFFRVPYTETNIFRGFANFAAWQTAGHDANGTYDGTNMVGGETEELFYNDTLIAKTFLLNGATAKDVYGTTITTSFTLQPFTSKIVTGTNLNLIE